LNILTDTKKLIAKNKGKITDYEVRLHIEKLYKKHNLVTVYHPVVASGKNTANPHYFTSKDNQNLIKENEILLIDIWGKINEQGSVFSDITTMFYTGKNIPQEIEKAWKVLINARDKALNTLKQNLNSKQIKANRIDMVARKVIEENGYGNYFIHRLGHNISTDLHGYGPNFDNYETIDGRKVLPSSGYSLEPGIYTKNFGLRSEINIYINRKGQVYETTPIPKFIEKI
jgi:Xaa-Pro aminopeptidase